MTESLGFSLRPYMLIKYLSLNDEVEVHVFTPFNEVVGGLKKVYFHKLRTFASGRLNEVIYKCSRAMFKKRIFVNSLIYKSYTLNRIIHSLANSLKEELIKYPVEILQAEQDIPAAAANIVRNHIGSPIVADVHDLWADEEFLSSRISPRSSACEVINNITRKAVEESDLVLVGNELMKKIIESRFSIKSSRIVVSPNGGELHKLEKYGERRKRIIYAGNFEPYEFVDFFLESAPHILREENDLEILIYGKGSEEPRLKKLAKRLGLPNSIFKGFIKRGELIPILAQSLVGVVPTRKRYASPLKLFEYLSVGLPVVSIKGMWWSNIIEEYHAGKTSEFDSEKYAEAILELVTTNDIEEFSMGALKIIRDKYNWFKIAEDLVSIYKELV
ncbi:MAG: glycosyltransferase [Thermoproteota archaeon]